MKLVGTTVLATLLALHAPARADNDTPPPPPTTDPAAVPAPPGPPVTTEPPSDATGAPAPPDRDVDNPVFRPLAHKDIVVVVPRDRDARNIAMIAGIAGAGALISAVGVYYNLDSKSAADAVTTKHPTNLPWTADDQATYDRAHSSGIKAGVFYGIGGAVLVGAIVTFIVTAPGTETTVIHPHYSALPTIAPAQGGAVLGGAWRF